MNLNEKSRLASFVLTFFFGPLGLLYASVGWALVLIIIAILSFPTIVGPLICWVMAIAIGDHCTHRHNQSVRKLFAVIGEKSAANEAKEAG